MRDNIAIDLEYSEFSLKRFSAMHTFKNEYVSRLESIIYSLVPDEKLERILRTKDLEVPIVSPSGTVIHQIFQPEIVLFEPEVGVMDEI